MPKSRMLFISNLYPNPSHVHMATFNRQQINSLRKHFDISVLAPIPWPVRMKQPEIPARRLEDGLTIHHPTYYYIPRFFRSWHGQSFYYSIRNVARQILSRNNYAFIYASWLFPDGWAAARIATEFNLPLYVKTHGTDVNRLNGDRSSRKALDVVNIASKILCVSRALKDKLVTQGASPEKLAVVYNGVDRKIFQPIPHSEARSRLGISQSERIVLFVGNMKEEKGLRELLLAFHMLTKKETGLRLVIIGDGPYKKKLQAMVARLQLSDSISLPGRLPLPTIAIWMNAATVFCLPSHSEGVPNVILEALSCGTPVVATSVGGIPEINECVPMELVPPKSVELLAAALGRSIANNREGQAVPYTTSWDDNADRLYSIFAIPDETTLN